MLSRFITPELTAFRDTALCETNVHILRGVPSDPAKLAVVSPYLPDTVRMKLMSTIFDLLDFYDIKWLRIAVQSDPTPLLSPGVAVVSLCTQRFIKADDHLYVTLDGSKTLRATTILEQFLIGQLKNPHQRLPSHPEELLLEFVQMNGYEKSPSSHQTLSARIDAAKSEALDYRALIDSLHVSEADQYHLASVSISDFDTVSYLVQHELIPPSHPTVRRRTWDTLSAENAKLDLVYAVGLIIAALCALVFNLQTVGKVSQLTIFFYSVTYLYEMLFPDIARYTKPSPRLVGSLSLAAGVVGINQGTWGISLMLIVIGLSSLSIFDDVVDYAIGSIGRTLVDLKERLF